MKKLSLLTVAAVLCFVGFASMAYASGPVHWGYEGDIGPDNWGELSPDFATCSTGVEQSPVDITADAPVNEADIQFNYQPSALTVVNNGHTIQANYDEGSSIVVNGETYNLLQFHFHEHSENTVAGEPGAMEIHFVHQNDSGELAVVGALMNVGAESEALAPVWTNMPAEEGEPVAVDGATVSADDILPADRTYYRFNGSLTTPPCSEGVTWLVMTNPIEISQEQLEAFQQIHSGNYRPVQPFNDRQFLVSADMDAAPAEMDAEMTEAAPETASETPAALPQTGGEKSPLLPSLLLGSAGLVIFLGGLKLGRRAVVVRKDS
ncbi:MAG: carbonic anhydrase family protein [Anaerolineae bacterium]|nr:carbonic anhydrase family protein [Anaerolineae bacterium]